MPRADAPEQVAAHRGLDSLPEAWIDLAYGRVSSEEALERVGAREPAPLARRSARMFEPTDDLRARARLNTLLGEHFAPPPRTRSGGRILGMMVAVAAAVVLVVMPRVRPEPPELRFDAGYELELGRALARERGAGPEGSPEGSPEHSPAHSPEGSPDRSPEGAPDRPRYRADRTIELTLRPAHRVDQPLGVRVFASGSRGPARALSVAPRVSPLGVVEILGQPWGWGLSPGTWELTVVVGPPAGLPEALGGVREDDDAPYDTSRARIDVLPPG